MNVAKNRLVITAGEKDDQEVDEEKAKDKKQEREKGGGAGVEKNAQSTVNGERRNKVMMNKITRRETEQPTHKWEQLALATLVRCIINRLIEEEKHFN